MERWKEDGVEVADDVRCVAKLRSSRRTSSEVRRTASVVRRTVSVVMFLKRFRLDSTEHQRRALHPMVVVEHAAR